MKSKAKRTIATLPHPAARKPVRTLYDDDIECIDSHVTALMRVKGLTRAAKQQILYILDHLDGSLDP
jgi:hypothetical protein